MSVGRTPLGSGSGHVLDKEADVGVSLGPRGQPTFGFRNRRPACLYRYLANRFDAKLASKGEYLRPNEPVPTSLAPMVA